MAVGPGAFRAQRLCDERVSRRPQAARERHRSGHFAPRVDSVVPCTCQTLIPGLCYDYEEGGTANEGMVSGFGCG